MSNQDAYKRRIEIVKYLQDKNLSTGQLAEYFDVDDRTIRSDVDALRMGYEFLGTILKIESKHEGSQKHFYKSTVHPIFLGMILSVLGLFIIIPNALTFFTTLSTYFIIQIQIRLEEAFLEKKHGAVYSNYKIKTKRLI
mgnify:CR=1 FL=1